MKFLPLLWAGLWRRPLRAVFTALSIVVAFMLIGLLQGVDAGFAAVIAEARREFLTTDARVRGSPPMPFAMREQIRKIPGIVAGIAGAIGAFCVLLAFGARGSPAAVMSIVFGGAPIVNAVVALLVHPPAGGWSGLRWQFLLGIALTAIGGCLVKLYKPPPEKVPPAAVSEVMPGTTATGACTATRSITYMAEP